MFYSIDEKRFSMHDGSTQFLIEGFDGKVRIKVVFIKGVRCGWGAEVDVDAKFGSDKCVTAASVRACGLMFGFRDDIKFIKYGEAICMMPKCKDGDIHAIEKEIKAFFR